MEKNKIIAHFEILDPPHKMDIPLKRPKIDKKTNKLITKNTYYLTNNIFFGNNTHWAIQYKVINYAKDWLMPLVKGIPKIKRCKITIIIYREDQNWDLDNKSGFWIKILLDLLKTPTAKQRAKALEKRTWIRSVEVLPDDTVKFVDGLEFYYKPGRNRMDIKITESKGDQTELF